MPVIHFHYIDALSKEQKKNLAASITKAVADSTGVPEEHVRIWMHQTSADEHSIGGVLLEDLIKG